MCIFNEGEARSVAKPWIEQSQMGVSQTQISIWEAFRTM